MESCKVKPLRRFGEGAYLVAILLLPLGVVLMTKADFGISMVVAPAYLLSLKISWMSFGVAEYAVQAMLLLAFCLIMRKFRLQYLLSFVTALVYGAILDGLFLLFTASVPSSMWLRVVLFLLGIIVSSAGIALFFRAYFPPEVYELFVQGVAQRLNKDVSRVKVVYDCCSCAVAIVLSLLFFKEITGVGIGTVVCALCNGWIIGLFGKLFDRYIDFSPAFPGLYRIIAGKAAP